MQLSRLGGFSHLQMPPLVLGVSLTLGNSSQGGEIWGSRRRPAVRSVLGSGPAGDKGGHCPSQQAMSRESLDGVLGCVGLGSPQCRHELGPHPTATYALFCVSLPKSVQWCVGVSVCPCTHMWVHLQSVCRVCGAWGTPDVYSVPAGGVVTTVMVLMRINSDTAPELLYFSHGTLTMAQCRGHPHLQGEEAEAQRS